MSKIGHYVVIKGRGYWSPTRAMKDAGFRLLSCGPDGPEARERARQAEASYQKWREEGDASRNPYPPGSFGSFWHHLHGTEMWKRKALSTRKDYEYVWEKYIGPSFGNRRIDDISPVDCEKFQIKVESDFGANERFKAVKTLRALFNAAIKYRVISQSPATTLPNPMPRGRLEFWVQHEVTKLIDDAWENDFHGMAVAISIAWDTMLSPVDVRMLVRSELREDGTGVFISIQRKKTDRPVLAPISPYTRDLLTSYIDLAEIPESPQARVIRMRNGGVYKAKDSFAKDFRRVRAISFSGDQRQFRDLRRSGNVEAYVGGADRDAMGKALGNRLGDNQFLFETYTPPTLEAARRVADARLHGRERLKPKED